MGLSEEVERSRWEWLDIASNQRENLIPLCIPELPASVAILSLRTSHVLELCSPTIRLNCKEESPTKF